MTDLRGHIAAALHEHGRSFADLERIADEVGIPKGERATDHQLAQVLVRVTQPASIDQPESARAHADSGVGAAPVARVGDGSARAASPPPFETPPEVREPVSATGQAETSPASPAPAQEKLAV